MILAWVPEAQTPRRSWPCPLRTRHRFGTGQQDRKFLFELGLVVRSGKNIVYSVLLSLSVEQSSPISSSKLLAGR